MSLGWLNGGMLGSGGEVFRCSGDPEHLNPGLCSLDHSSSHLLTDLPLSHYPL